jgi:hypothetical protein
MQPMVNIELEKVDVDVMKELGEDYVLIISLYVPDMTAGTKPGGLSVPQ